MKALEMLGDPENVTAVAWEASGVEFEEGHLGGWEPEPLMRQWEW